MTRKTQGAWITLNTSYYAAHICNPLDLLHDSLWLLRCARGVSDVLSTSPAEPEGIDARSVAYAHAAITTLLDMAAGSVDAARSRFVSMANDDYAEY